MKHYCEDTASVLRHVQSDEGGLTAQEAEKRLAQNGKNKLAEAKKDSLLKRFISQLMDPMILILLAAATISGILAVVDDRSVSSLLHALLDTQGYETLLADSCDQGMMMIRSHVPDLVILDLGLPDKDGLELIRSVRQDNAVPILVLSARSTEQDKVTALDLGANDYITKPFSAAELLARVRAALRYSRPGGLQGRLPDGRFSFTIC